MYHLKSGAQVDGVDLSKPLSYADRFRIQCNHRLDFNWLSLVSGRFILPSAAYIPLRAARLVCPRSAHVPSRSFLSPPPFVSLPPGLAIRMDGASQVLSSTVVRYFYLKQVTSYAGASSMVLLLHDFCKHDFFYVFARAGMFNLASQCQHLAKR